MERNSFTSPVKDRLLPFNSLKSKLPPPPLQSAFARYNKDDLEVSIYVNFRYFNFQPLYCFLLVLCFECLSNAAQQSQIQEVEGKHVQKLGSTFFLARYCITLLCHIKTMVNLITIFTFYFCGFKGNHFLCATVYMCCSLFIQFSKTSTCYFKAPSL